MDGHQSPRTEQSPRCRMLGAGSLYVHSFFDRISIGLAVRVSASAGGCRRSGGAHPRPATTAGNISAANHPGSFPRIGTCPASWPVAVVTTQQPPGSTIRPGQKFFLNIEFYKDRVCLSDIPRVLVFRSVCGCILDTGKKVQVLCSLIINCSQNSRRGRGFASGAFL